MWTFSFILTYSFLGTKLLVWHSFYSSHQLWHLDYWLSSICHCIGIEWSFFLFSFILWIFIFIMPSCIHMQSSCNWEKIVLLIEFMTHNCIYLDIPRGIVSSSKPMEEAGMYWGYRVRYASNLSSVFKDCPHKVFILILPHWFFLLSLSFFSFLFSIVSW